MAHDSDSHELPLVRLEAAPRGALGLSIVLVLLGAAAFAGALLTDADRAWRAYLFNWLFVTSLAMGAVMVAVIVTITRGAWSRGIRRIALAFVAFLPIAWLLMLPMFFAAAHIFPWVNEPVAGKEAYLNIPFLVLRNTLLLALLFGLCIVFARTALRPDLGGNNAGAGNAAALWRSLTRGWRGQEAEELAAYRRLAKLAPAVALIWAAALSVVAWDFIMSLEPHWFSTLIGPYYFMAGLLGGFAVTAIAARYLTRAAGAPDVITTSQWHDLGKLTFGFTVFWAYLFFSQYIVIWYGLIPSEQSFVIHRFAPPFGLIAKLVGLCVFVIPFFTLLGAAPKKRPELLTKFVLVTLVGLWLERYLLVYPSHYAGRESLPLGWQEVGTALLFIGLLIASVTWFATRFPLFQIWQPLSELELRGVPVPVDDRSPSGVS
jgi:hypothetical protein